MPRFVIIAGENSGDQLAGGLIRSLKMIYPDAEFEGITGPKMRAAGCHSWGDMEQLSVMGLFEVIRHLPRLWRLKRDLEQRLKSKPPDVFIGIDAPDFNLRLEQFARKQGIPTVHYVCPSVWAWRPGRVKHIYAACELVLCLLPFEPAFLAKHDVPAMFVGHPMADDIDGGMNAVQSRSALGLQEQGKLVALLPGSRMGEVSYLGPEFTDAAAVMLQKNPELRFVVPAATPVIREAMQHQVARAGIAGNVTLLDGQAREAIAAADAVLLASGTATLETMLVGRPMVVAYKVFPLTAWLLRKTGIFNISRFSLPNLLADTDLVPEMLQEEATGYKLAEAMQKLLDDDQGPLVQKFSELGSLLRRDASKQAAKGIAQLIDSP